MRKLTTAGKAFVTAAILLLGAGAFAGNPAMLAAGALPLLFVTGAAARPPRVRVERALDAEDVPRGDEVEVTLRVDVPGRHGILEVHQAIPDPFALAGKAESNYRVLRTRRGHGGARDVKFRFVATKRGEWELAPVTVRWIDPLGLVTHEPVPATDPVTLSVRPSAKHGRLMRDVPAKATQPLPDADHAQFGLSTTQFRELREYVPGDPVRSVNWKATARRLATGAGDSLLVNEYEREGKKSVWLLVDGGATLEIGDTVADAREEAVDAALGYTRELARRGYQVGFATFRAQDPVIMQPMSGDALVHRVRRALQGLAPADGPSLRDVLDRTAARLHATKPLVVVFTRLDDSDEGLADGLKRARQLQGARPHGPSAVVLDLEPWSRYPQDDGAEAAVAERRARHRAAKRRARATGARVIEWDPGAQAFQAVVGRKGVPS